MTALLGAAGPSAYWYLTRSTGVVSLLLLTLSVVLGVVDVRRLATTRWPRFVLDALHRNVSLLVIVFLALHIVTAALDSFAAIPLTDAVVPFVGSYRAVWLGLGALAFDLLVAITITSLLRQRIGHRTWRTIHWLAYGSWPLALVHTLGTGSDVKSGWLLVLSAVCLLAVLGAVVVRATSGWPAQAGLRGGALAGTGVLLIVLFAWLPGGPLGKGWARRSGTPTALLAASSASASTAGSGSSGQAPSPGELLTQRFKARLSGTLREIAGPEVGLTTVKIVANFSGSPSGTIDVELTGPPAVGGGVTRVLSSHVTLGSPPATAAYEGGVVTLDEAEIVARVKGSGGELSLHVALSGNAAGPVTGTLSSAPV